MSFIYDKRMHDINQRKQSLNNIGKQKKKKEVNITWHGPMNDKETKTN